MKKNRLDVKEIFIFVLSLGFATLTGYLFRHAHFPEANIVIIHILSVILIARFTQGFLYGISASLVATFSFNYFFTAPYYTFSVNNPSYILTFIVMTLTALITSALTSKVKLSALEAEEKASEINTLYTLTNQLSDAATIEDIPEITINNISQCIGTGVGCLLFGEDGFPEKTFLQQNHGGGIVRRDTGNRKLLKEELCNLRTQGFTDSEFFNLPIYGQEKPLGFIRIPEAGRISASKMKVVYSMSENIGMAIDRLQYRSQQLQNQELVMQERYRSSLLRAISHDLRTPLAGIMGTSEMLLGKTEVGDDRYQLIEGIYQDADWLYRLVENILSLTRLQDGNLMLNKVPEAVEEVIDGALQRLHRSAPQYDIAVSIPDEFLLVPMDAKLIGQVLLNLLENAVKHTKDYDGISIRVEKDNTAGKLVFYVTDNGEGIAETDLPNIFQMFYTSKERHVDAKMGIGLGLAICDAIVNAHGGEIKAGNREGCSGAEFTFTLPLLEKGGCNA